MPAEGLIAGTEYHFKTRAKNFFTHYYSKGDLSPWSATSVFYSSNLPETVQYLSFPAEYRLKTGAKIEWQHLDSEEKKGFSTIDVYYLLWVDDCQGGSIDNLLVNSTTIVDHTVTNIPPGSTCRFRMNTLNIIGYSKAYSAVLNVLMASIP